LGSGSLGAVRPATFAPTEALPSQLAATSPVSAANPLSTAAGPAASGLGSGGGLLRRLRSGAVSGSAPDPGSGGAGGPAGGGYAVGAVGMTSATPPPVASSAPPPLAGPNTPSAPLAPVAPTPTVPPPGVGAPPGPFHSPLPPVGAPIVRGGLVERAEDPDIVPARQLIWDMYGREGGTRRVIGRSGYTGAAARMARPSSS
jgi:hypothetical protein